MNDFIVEHSSSDMVTTSDNAISTDAERQPMLIASSTEDVLEAYPVLKAKKRPIRKTVTRLEELRSMPYEEYLQTPEWQEKRKKALRAADYKCQLCYASQLLHVHHRTYERRGYEDLADLTVLCKKCHEHFHMHNSQEEAKGHMHKFNMIVKKKRTIQWCETCGQTNILEQDAKGYRWQKVTV